MNLSRLLSALRMPSHQGMRDKDRRRIARLLMVASGFSIVEGTFWGVLSYHYGRYLPMAVHACLVVTGIATGALVWRGRLRAAAFITTTALFSILVWFCLFVDVPLPNVPRAVHVFFLALGAAAFLFFRTERPLIRLGAPVLCFAAFVLFASGHLGWPNSPYLLPDAMRASNAWVNNIAACVTLFSALHIMQTTWSTRSAIETDLRSAIAQGQFELHYQAQVDDAGAIVGAEALLRWKHPQRGWISPSTFIPVAEETGLILPIGEWVIKEACARLVSWSTDPRTAHLTLAVNVSASQFRQPDFVAQVMGIVERSGVRPQRLKLELTESMLVKDVDDVIGKMTSLQRAGVRFSLDDFGTGYSSLSYLKRLPLDQLKIDQSFVRELVSNPHDMAIARTVISLGDNLGLSVIAEGVETEAQRAWLCEHGCRFYQGYLFSKPVPVHEFEDLVMASAVGTAVLTTTPGLRLDTRPSTIY